MDLLLVCSIIEIVYNFFQLIQELCFPSCSFYKKGSFCFFILYMG